MEASEELSLADPGFFRAGFDHIKRNDQRLRPVLESRGVIRFKPRGEPFESLVESVLSQQLASSAAESIIRKVRAVFPEGRLEPHGVHLADPRRLRAAGVSPQKLSYLKDLSSKVVGGALDLDALREMPDEEIIGVLDEVKGIGPWTVQMFLIFTLGRPDVLPVDDYGIRTSVKRIYGLRELPNKAKIERLAGRWHPFCTVASLYLWYAKDKES